MGLFGRRSGTKGQAALPDSLVSFLNDADTEYMQAFSTKSMRKLQDFVSRECAIKVSRVVFGRVNRYFGARKFRSTSWSVQEKEDGKYRILKDVQFDMVRVGVTLRVGVAGDYKEVWSVDVNGRKPIITDISTA